MTPSSIGHYYEDFMVGEVIQHSLSKTIDDGKGVAVVDNKFIGPPMLRMANEILNKARMYGL